MKTLLVTSPTLARAGPKRRPNQPSVITSRNSGLVPATVWASMKPIPISQKTDTAVTTNNSSWRRWPCTT